MFNMGQLDIESILNDPIQEELARDKVRDFRKAVSQNRELSREDLAEGLRLLRLLYGKEAQTVKPKKKAAPKKAAPKKKVSMDDVLGNLGL